MLKRSQGETVTKREVRLTMAGQRPYCRVGAGSGLRPTAILGTQAGRRLRILTTLKGPLKGWVRGWRGLTSSSTAARPGPSSTSRARAALGLVIGVFFLLPVLVFIPAIRTLMELELGRENQCISYNRKKSMASMFKT